MQGTHSHLNAPIALGKAGSTPGDLHVLTLNYCGIMNNPFEFYSQSMGTELAAISQIFDDLVHFYFKLEKGSNKF
jgi:hypothetical protein